MTSTSFRTGLSTREVAVVRSLVRAAFWVVAAVLAWVSFAFLPHAQILAPGMALILFLAFKGVTVVMESKIGAEKLASRGVPAEERVQDILDQLGSEHLIVHDVPCQFGNIDHIVFSKNHGVFLIETIAHGSRVAVADSRILVNGKRPEHDLISQTLRHTHWLVEEVQALTGVSAKVNALVVFTDAFVVTNRAVMGITVTNKKFLLSSIQRLGKPLAPEVWAARESIAAGLLKRTV